MPKSKLRKKVQEQHAHEEQHHIEEESVLLESPSWLAPVMVANFLIGLFWIVGPMTELLRLKREL